MDAIGLFIAAIIGFGLGMVIFKHLGRKNVAKMKDVAAEYDAALFAIYSIEKVVTIPAGEDEYGNPTPERNVTIRVFSDDRAGLARSVYKREAANIK